MSNYIAQITAAFTARASYEAAKNADNDSMQSTLKAMSATVSHAAIADVLSAANVSADFINKSERSSARFNVYAAEKVLNIAQNAAKVKALNHYTLAILRVAVALSTLPENARLTHADAQSACSLSVKVKDAKREKLIAAKKYQKITSNSTAATQSSSSINALQMFNILIEERDAANTVCYRLNVESEAFKLLSI